MRMICRLLMYYQYVDVDSKDIIKLIKLYEYN